MEKTWRDVKNRIEDEIDSIWWEEPVEFQMARQGYFPSGANVDGSVFGNLMFLIADTANIGRHVAVPAIYAALEDDTFSLDVIKKMFSYLNRDRCRLVGSMEPPNCPAPWMNLGKVWIFFREIEEVLDTITTKAEFHELFYSWANYLSCLNRWAMVTFPWDVGWDRFQLRTESPFSKDNLAAR